VSIAVPDSNQPQRFWDGFQWIVRTSQ
jgi:hypothetical protein